MSADEPEGSAGDEEASEMTTVTLGPAEIPTASTWGLLLLATLLAIAGLRVLRPFP